MIEVRAISASPGNQNENDLRFLAIYGAGPAAFALSEYIQASPGDSEGPRGAPGSGRADSGEGWNVQ